MPKGRKLDFDFVKDCFKQQGCQLLESEYSNNCNPMKYRCSCGCTSTISFNNFQKGRRCKNCCVDRASSKKRHALDDVRKTFSDAGCCLLEQEYLNNYTPMKYRCSCGSESVIRLFSFVNGQRCKNCSMSCGESHYNWNPNRDEVEFNRKFRSRQNHLLNSVLSSLGKSKRYKSSDHLGYTTGKLKERIQSHPNWADVKERVWHIDHIFPVKAFLDYGVKDVKVINALENLQPLSASDNLSKNDKYDPEEFEKWLIARDVAFVKPV